jgi:hypothetical protein
MCSQTSKVDLKISFSERLMQLFEQRNFESPLARAKNLQILPSEALFIFVHSQVEDHFVQRKTQNGTKASFVGGGRSRV